MATNIAKDDMSNALGDITSFETLKNLFKSIFSRNTLPTNASMNVIVAIE